MAHRLTFRTPLDRVPAARASVVALLAIAALVAWFVLVVEPVSSRAWGFGPSPFAEWPSGNFALDVAASAVVSLAGLSAFAAAYVRLRDLPVPTDLPDRSALPLVAVAALVPPALVALAAILSSATGTGLSAVAGVGIAADTTWPSLAATTLAMLFVSLPAYLVVAHVLVQSALADATDRWTALALTAALVLAIGPGEFDVLVADHVDALRPIGAAVAVALPVYARASFDRRWLTALCAVPLAAIAIGVVGRWLGGLDGPAAAALTVAEAVVVLVGVYGCDRTDSLVPSALAYASYVVAIDAFVFLFDAGFGG